VKVAIAGKNRAIIDPTTAITPKTICTARIHPGDFVSDNVIHY
jgi:hypothetical protein